MIHEPQITSDCLCGITGYSPSQYFFGLDDEHPYCQRLKLNLKIALLGYIHVDINNFIVPITLGTDLWCCELLIELKQVYHYPLTFYAVEPHEEYHCTWSPDMQRRYRKIVQGCDEMIILNCYKELPQYLESKAHRILCISDPEHPKEKKLQRLLYYAKSNRTHVDFFNPYKSFE